MAYNNVDTSSGVIIAIGTDGYVDSKPIMQDEPVNISESTEIDTLVTSTKIIEGEELIIELEDGSKHNFICGEVMSDEGIIAIKNRDPDIVFGCSENTYGECFFGSTNTDTSYALPIYFDVACNIPTKFHTGFLMKPGGSNDGKRTPKRMYFYGSQTGEFSGEETIIVNNLDTSGVYPNGETYFSFTNDTYYNYYRISFTEKGVETYRLESGGLWFDYTDGEYTVDTSSVTNGEVPLIAYKKADYPKDFTSVKDIISKFEFANISKTVVADLLVTSEPIKDGDNLVIIVNNSIAEQEQTVQMTGDNTPSGYAVIASSYYNEDSSYKPWKGFQSDHNTGIWCSNETNTDEWIEIEFPTQIIINKYSGIFSDNNNGIYFPTTINVKGYNGTNWISIESPTIVDSGDLQQIIIEFENDIAYSKYRLYISNDTTPSYKGGYDIRMFTSEIIRTEAHEIVANGVVIDSGIVNDTDPFNDNSLIHKFLLNDTITDSISGVDGTPTDIEYIDGVFENGGIFNGSTSQILFDTINFNGLSWSFSCMCNKSSTKSNAYLLGSKVAGGQNAQMHLGFEDTSNFRVAFWGDDLTCSFSSITNKWYHILFTFDATSKLGIIYIDNVEIGSRTYNDTYNGDLGAIGYGNDNYFEGIIDQIEIYNKVLSSSERLAINTQYENKYQMDTTSITQGKIPAEVYRVDESIEFNNNIAIESNNTYEFLDTVSILDKFNDGSCIAMYALNDNFNDKSGNYNATGSTGMTFISGKHDDAVLKSTHDDYIYIAGLPQMSKWTFTLWINFSNVNPNTYPGIIGPENGGNESLRSSHSGNKKFLINYGGGDFDTGIDSSQYEDEWTFISFSSDGSYFKLVINDFENTSTKVDSKVWDTTAIAFGKQFGNNQGFEGSMDQIRIFNKALTESEISTVYNEGIKFITTRTFSDRVISGYECITRVNMSATGNKMTKLDFDIYKKE